MKFLHRAGLGAAGLACLAVLAACATPSGPRPVKLTYESDPPGATIWEGGQNLGMEPVTRTYLPSEGAATLRTPEVTVVWPSGVKEVWFTILRPGDDNVAVIARPKVEAGLQADLEHGRKVLSNRTAASTRQRDDVRRDQARNSEECKRQQAGRSLAVQDDC